MEISNEDISWLRRYISKELDVEYVKSQKRDGKVLFVHKGELLAVFEPKRCKLAINGDELTWVDVSNIIAAGRVIRNRDKYAEEEGFCRCKEDCTCKDYPYEKEDWCPLAPDTGDVWKVWLRLDTREKNTVMKDVGRYPYSHLYTVISSWHKKAGL